MGVILYILLCGKPPFDDLHHIALAQYDFSDDAWTRVSIEAKDLIKRMLVADPANRLRAQEMLNHPWIQGKKLSVASATQFAAPAPKKAKTDDNDDAFQSPKAVATSPTTKAPCRYGKSCYRKNPQHLLQFSHD
jgi:serine/threonine protein kinase